MDSVPVTKTSTTLQWWWLLFSNYTQFNQRDQRSIFRARIEIDMTQCVITSIEDNSAKDGRPIVMMFI